MHTKVADFLRQVSAEPGSGTEIYPLEVSRALNLLPDELTQLLDREFDIEECSRVNYSYRINWVDILIMLSNGSERRQFIVTYDAQSDEFVGLTRTDQRFESVGGPDKHLPFALAAKSHTVDVVASENEMLKINSRRDVFTKALVAGLAPFLVTVSPAMAASTAYTTNSQTGSNKAQQTSRGTSGVTTPNDQDTRTDTVTDNTTDYKQDSTQDHRDDK